jgi:hypothetical protein
MLFLLTKARTAFSLTQYFCNLHAKSLPSEQTTAKAAPSPADQGLLTALELRGGRSNRSLPLATDINL